MSCDCNACGLVFNGIPGEFPEVGDIIDAANIVAGWDAADLVASPVALWPDASGNGFDLTNAVGAEQPLWTAAGGPNGNPTVLFDGDDDFLSNALLDLPAPGTTPTFYWAVLRQVTWVLDHTIADTPLASLSFYQGSAAAPNVRQFNSNEVNENSGAPLGEYKRCEVYFSSSVADYIKAGSTTVTGADAGNSEPAASFALGGLTALFRSNVEVCEFWIFNFLPSAAQLASLDAYVLNRYGVGLI